MREDRESAAPSHPPPFHRPTAPHSAASISHPRRNSHHSLLATLTQAMGQQSHINYQAVAPPTTHTTASCRCTA